MWSEWSGVEWSGCHYARASASATYQQTDRPVQARAISYPTIFFSFSLICCNISTVQGPYTFHSQPTNSTPLPLTRDTNDHG